MNPREWQLGLTCDCSIVCVGRTSIPWSRLSRLWKQPHGGYLSDIFVQPDKVVDLYLQSVLHMLLPQHLLIVPVGGKFRLVPSLGTRSLEINCLMHAACETKTLISSDSSIPATLQPRQSSQTCCCFSSAPGGLQPGSPRHSAEPLLLPHGINFIYIKWFETNGQRELH